MNELTLTQKDGVLVADSREVANMIGKRHSDLLRDIQAYNRILENAKLRSHDFFIHSTYKAEGNKKDYGCYLLTRKGCDMVANKMTGEKGVLFTAEYVSKFEEMEKKLQQPKALNEKEQLIASMKLTLETSEELSEVKTKVTSLEERFDNELTLDHGQSVSLNHAVKKRVEKLWEDGITGTLETKKQLYAKIYNQMKRAFQAPTYREVKRKDFDEVISWVSAWRPL